MPALRKPLALRPFDSRARSRHVLVMLVRSTDPRLWRLFDLEPNETIAITCACSHIISYGPGVLQKQRKRPSDTLIYDLQYRLRCQRCGRTNGFAIAVIMMRTDRSNLSGERFTETVIVAGD